MRFATLVLKNLTRRPVRSLLTVVGLSIAIAAVVALVGVANGFERSFMDYYTQRGIDFVVQRAGGGSEALNNTLPEQLRERLQKVPGVKSIMCRLIDTVSFEQQGIIGVILNGWPDESPLYDRVTVLEGRRPAVGDKHVAFLGRVLSQNLSKRLGDDIEFYGEQFKIVGIFESPTVFENGGIVIRLAELQRLMHRPNEVTGFAIIGEHPTGDTELGDLQTRLEHLQPNLKVTAAADFVRNLAQIRQCQAVAWASSAIALVIGAIGILNTMMTSVFERTSEIGVLRAIGWPQSRIARMVMSESIMLSLCGAVLGTFAGAALVKLLSRFPSAAGLVEGKIDIMVVGQGIAAAMLIGVAGSLYPAVWSARVLPTEAIRRK
jgi:putative ABC transport system permease protein